MMLKLYKKDNDRILYWEAWQAVGTVVLHWGTLGTKGQTRDIRLSGASAEDVIETQAAAPRAEGYEELDEEDLLTFVVQYRLDTWGSSEDLEKRHHIENLMNECLGWTGNGHCDGGDIGSGSMNVWCYVVDPHLAADAAIEELRTHRMLEGAVMAYGKDDNYLVIWPPDYQGQFSAL